jgi:hypothetical protein
MFRVDTEERGTVSSASLYAALSFEKYQTIKLSKDKFKVIENKTFSEMKAQIEELSAEYLYFMPDIFQEIISPATFTAEDKLNLLQILLQKNSSALYLNALMNALSCHKATFTDLLLHGLLINLYTRYLKSNELALSMADETCILECLILSKHSRQLELFDSLFSAARPGKLARELKFVAIWLYSCSSEQEVLNTYKIIKDTIRGKELNSFEFNIKEIAKLVILFIKMHAVDRGRKLAAETEAEEREVIAFLGDGRTFFSSRSTGLYDLIRAQPGIISASGFIDSRVIVKLNKGQKDLDARINKALDVYPSHTFQEPFHLPYFKHYPIANTENLEETPEVDSPGIHC